MDPVDAARGVLPGWPLAVFRIALGILYIDMALQKAPWKHFGWLEGFIRQEIEHPAFVVVAGFLRDVVLPNLTLFATLTLLVDLALGVALLARLLTRPAAPARWCFRGPCLLQPAGDGRVARNWTVAVASPGVCHEVGRRFAHASVAPGVLALVEGLPQPLNRAKAPALHVFAPPLAVGAG